MAAWGGDFLTFPGPGPFQRPLCHPPRRVPAPRLTSDCPYGCRPCVATAQTPRPPTLDCELGLSLV